jgi:acyl-CoA dehydrogenase
MKARSTSWVPSSKPLKLAEVILGLHEIRQLTAVGAGDYDQLETVRADPGPQFVARMNALEVSITSRVEVVASRSMRACGLGGYVNSDSASIARLLRDVTDGPLMVDNDRALLANANPLLMRRSL